MGSFDNTERVIRETTLSIGRKGESKVCARLVVKIVSRVILSSVVPTP